MSAIQSSPLYYFRLISPTVTVDLTTTPVNATTDFNTNIPFGLAMLIRRVRTVIATKENIIIGSDHVSQILYELTEDTTRTTVAQTDPFALVDGGLEVYEDLGTDVGHIWAQRNLVADSFNFDPPHPGVPTVAQQLSLVATGIRVAGTSTQSWDVFLQLYYELIPLNENIRTFLANRIALQRVT